MESKLKRWTNKVKRTFVLAVFAVAGRGSPSSLSPNATCAISLQNVIRNHVDKANRNNNNRVHCFNQAEGLFA